MQPLNYTLGQHATSTEPTMLDFAHLQLSAEEGHAIFHAGLGLHNANLPIWDRHICDKKMPANEFIQRSKNLSDAVKAAVWHYACLAEFGDAPHQAEHRPHRLMLGLMAHLAVLAERKGYALYDMVPRMAWSKRTSKAERFVRLALVFAGRDTNGNDCLVEKRIEQLLPLIEPVFKKRTGQGGVRELRAFAQKLAAMSCESEDDFATCAKSQARRPALVPSPLRSPRTLERPLLSASRRPSHAALPENDVLLEDDGFARISPQLSRTTSFESDTPYNELVNQLRNNKANLRRPSTLSLSSSWAGVSDVPSNQSEGHESWQDVESQDL